jgi:hypothetical protein
MERQSQTNLLIIKKLVMTEFSMGGKFWEVLEQTTLKFQAKIM